MPQVSVPGPGFKTRRESTDFLISILKDPPLLVLSSHASEWLYDELELSKYLCWSKWSLK